MHRLFQPKIDSRRTDIIFHNVATDLKRIVVEAHIVYQDKTYLIYSFNKQLWTDSWKFLIFIGWLLIVKALADIFLLLSFIYTTHDVTVYTTHDVSDYILPPVFFY